MAHHAGSLRVAMERGIDAHGGHRTYGTHGWHRRPNHPGFYVRI